MSELDRCKTWKETADVQLREIDNAIAYNIEEIEMFLGCCDDGDNRTEDIQTHLNELKQLFDEREGI